MSSWVPNSPRCALPTLSTTETAGGAIAQRVRRWPRPRAPISSTRNRVLRSARSTVSGRPSSLLNDPWVATVGAAAPSTAPRRSLVEVLPCEPVTAATVRPGRAARTWRARRPRATWTSSTTTAGTPTGRPARTAAAPPATADAANRWASRCSPTKAANSPPGSGALLSRNAGPVTVTGSGSSWTVPSTTSAISARVIAIMAPPRRAGSPPAPAASRGRRPGRRRGAPSLVPPGRSRGPCP